MQDNSNEEPKVIKTDAGAVDGQNKCPKCGATDISLNVKTGKLRCNYCRHEFEPEKIIGLEENISNLQGEIVGSGTQDIQQDFDNIKTFKCSSCGAEVVIDTSESTQARCHWCRNTLSVNAQIPNGSVPDVVLPFKISKKEAQFEIDKFVGKRKFFAHPKFREEFTTDNIMGVYFPYMIVDVNSHASLLGKGEHETRRYTRGNDENRRTYYDADLYRVGRDFDLTIKGLTVESSSDKLDKNASNKTNNIINAIMPFDTENSVKWNANYLKGYTSEKRDTNIEQLRPIVEEQSKDIARYAANDTLKHYDRGVCWETENLEVKGQQWKAAYLPVWLYSYMDTNSTLHYVAVNARTKETIGSVPIHQPKLWAMSILVEIISFIGVLLARDFKYKWLFLLAGIIYYAVMYSRYRNQGARHYHEKETEKQMTNLKQVDELIRHETGLTRSRIEGANNTRVTGQNISEKVLSTIKNNIDL